MAQETHPCPISQDHDHLPPQPLLSPLYTSNNNIHNGTGVAYIYTIYWKRSCRFCLLDIPCGSPRITPLGRNEQAEEVKGIHVPRLTIPRLRARRRRRSGKTILPQWPPTLRSRVQRVSMGVQDLQALPRALAVVLDIRNMMGKAVQHHGSLQS